MSKTTNLAIDTLNKEKNMDADLPEYFLANDLDTRRTELADLGLWALQVFNEQLCLQKPLELYHHHLQGVLRPILNDAERLGLIIKASSLD